MGMMIRLLAIAVIGILISSTLADEASGLIKINADTLDIGHAKNIIRMKNRILQESGISETTMPEITPARRARVQAAFNDTDSGYAFYNEEDAYEYVNLIGHSTANTSDSVSFSFGEKTRTKRIESAKLTFFLRTALSPQAQKANVEVKGEDNEVIAAVQVTAPNSPTKKYSVPLSREALEKAVAASESEEVLKLKISAKASGDPSDELLIVKDRLGYQPHMGVILEIQFPSALLLARRRRRRSMDHVLRGQCHEGQTTCCPHVQTFNWEELGITHIIAPAKFHSVICRGSCDGFAYTDYKHTKNRQLVTEHSRKACCHPIGFEGQRIIWMGAEDEVIQREISNFYATRCGCD